MKVFAGDLCQAIEGSHGKRLRVFLQARRPWFGGGDGELRDGRSLLAVFHRASTARAASSGWAGSASRATGFCGRCWWKRRRARCAMTRVCGEPYLHRCHRKPKGVAKVAAARNWQYDSTG